VWSLVAVEARMSDGKRVSLLRITLPKLDVAGSSPVARSESFPSDDVCCTNATVTATVAFFVGAGLGGTYG
jgi:hypothetical protein